ncbi:DUF721 domain-containing protein [Treponema sp. OMZ 840]|uniref:DUF721 domain-containing protein n=1 Tax=Treponema sp. OMZ 840 TaxID=244313 RepID=UPI003D8EF02E
MSNEDFSVQSASDLLNTFFTDVFSCAAGEKGGLERSWNTVLQKIPNDGEKLAAHSRIIDLKNDILFLETDHSGWIQLFGLYKKRILAALKKEFPELTVNGFSFSLKKTEKKTGGTLRNITVDEKERWMEERGL